MNCEVCDKWPTDFPVFKKTGILCVDCAKHKINDMETENTKLNDMLRWRDTAVEKPEPGTLCLIVMKNNIWPNVI